MKFSRKLILSASSLIISASLLAGVNPAQAHDLIYHTSDTPLDDGNYHNGYYWSYDQAHRDDLAHQLALKFNLNENDVRSFLNNYYGVDLDDSPAYHRTSHLDFINAKLTKAVNDGWLNNTQKKDVLDKLQSMMKSGPDSARFAAMSASDQNKAINNWKNEMRKWCREHNMTLDQLRNLTGKGNKYLMGIELD